MTTVYALAAAFGVFVCTVTLVQALAFYNVTEPLIARVEERFGEAPPAQKARTLSIWIATTAAVHLVWGAVFLWVLLWCFERTGFGALRYLVPAYLATGVLGCLWTLGVAVVCRLWVPTVTSAAKATFLSWAVWLTLHRV